jgi:hypothetical protein
VINPDGSTELYFEKLGHWDYYQLILRILIEYNDCNVIEENDMITDHESLLRVNDILFYLKHDYMLGNYIYTDRQQDVSVLERLALNVMAAI